MVYPSSVVMRRTGWLSRQPAWFRDRVLDLCETRTYQVGEKLYGLDDRTGGMFGIVEGFVDVILGVGPFPPFLAFVGRPGWWVGEAAAMTNTNRRSEVHARTPAQALYLSAERMVTLTTDDPEAWRRFAQLSVDHMDNALLLAATLNHANLRERVLATLWRLSGPESQSDEMIELPCMQTEIAELAGLSRNSVGPIMRRLVDEGLIEMQRRRLRYRPMMVRKALE
mgnify:CR=1 FL=1